MDRPGPDRRVVKDALRAVGLSRREVDALLSRGWRGLVDAREAELAELRDRLAELQGALQR